MNGIELSKKYFEEFGRPMLESEFADILPYLAVGFVGSGSEHYGFDDEVSLDHDYEPGFNIFLPSEDVIDRKTEFNLHRAYTKLPSEFMGVKRLGLAPVGGSRNGEIRTAEFYRKAVGREDGELSMEEWLRIPDYALAEATNGEVFFDNYGEFTRIRESLKNMPRDAKLKRLAGNILLMAQSGQYNFERCLKHGETEAAQLALNEFVQAAMKTEFLLQDKYMPYYKWSFRALRKLDGGNEKAEKLSALLFGDNKDKGVQADKIKLIEEISSEVATRLRESKLTEVNSGDLEKQAYFLNDSIEGSSIRNMSIFAGV